MAYSTANPPRMISEAGIVPGGRAATTALSSGDFGGGSIWLYRSTHASGEIVSTGFFVRGGDIGLRLGDLLINFPQSGAESSKITLHAFYRSSFGTTGTTASTGLGFYNFDGISGAVQAGAPLWIEAYAGRSLVRGLNEPRTSGALQAIEALAPPAAGLLLGAQARYRPDPRIALSATYQVDFRDDGTGLYAELAAAEGVFRAAGGSIDAGIEVDVAAGALNEARLSIRAPPVGRVATRLEIRRYRPYFELWTIWGAFSPVGFDEVQAGATWADARGRVIVRGETSYRRYGETGADGPLDLRESGWGLGAGVSWLPDAAWRLDGSYRVEAGVGAARIEGQAGIQRLLGDRGTLAVQAVAFQRLYEFRLNEGTVFGVGAEGSVRLSERARVFASITGYRHVEGGTVPGLDWTQRRANVRLQWTLGREPGLPAGSP